MPDTRYGYYRYGRHEYHPIDTSGRSRVKRDTGPTPLERFGTGIALRTASDEGEGVPWDFVADGTGDLAATAGYDELAKNLAFRTAVDAVTISGQLGNANERARAEQKLTEAILENVHIGDASIEVSLVRDHPLLLIDITVTTPDGDAELVSVPFARAGDQAATEG